MVTLPFTREGRSREASPAAEAPDAVLAERALTDRDAFAALYDRHFAGVYAYSLRSIGSPERAEDATHLIFVRAMEALPRYREAGRFRQWLYTIAHNVIATELRWNRPTATLDEVAEVAAAGASVEDAVADRIDHDALWAVIANLPADQRRVVELRIAGYAGQEIAAAMNRGHDAVRMLQQRAFERLRRELGVERSAR